MFVIQALVVSVGVVPFWLLRAFYDARSSVGKAHEYWQEGLPAAG